MKKKRFCPSGSPYALCVVLPCFFNPSVSALHKHADTQHSRAFQALQLKACCVKRVFLSWRTAAVVPHVSTASNKTQGCSKMNVREWKNAAVAQWEASNNTQRWKKINSPGEKCLIFWNICCLHPWTKCTALTLPSALPCFPHYIQYFIFYLIIYAQERVHRCMSRVKHFSARWAKCWVHIWDRRRAQHILYRHLHSNTRTNTRAHT